MRAVPQEAKELARDMAFRPDNYQRFSNNEGILPAGRGYYIEGTPVMGQAEGRGQYRVVCLVEHGKVQKKYWSATHYGTGADAGTRPDFVEFQ